MWTWTRWCCPSSASREHAVYLRTGWWGGYSATSTSRGCGLWVVLLEFHVSNASIVHQHACIQKWAVQYSRQLPSSVAPMRTPLSAWNS